MKSRVKSLQPTEPARVVISTPRDKIPIDTCKTEEEFVLAVRYNSESFDLARFRTWLDYQPSPIQKVARICGPTGVYRERKSGAACAVTGYKLIGKEGAVVVILFGQDVPQIVEPSQLETLPAA